ncbi:cell surface protein SprA, partial [Bacteroidota bacterium]
GQSSVIEVEGGATTSNFEVLASEYEANRHFFLSHYFKEIYDKALETLPIISSGITITKMEVWVTNKTSEYSNSRNILGFLDLAEGNNPTGTNIFNTGFVNYNTGMGNFPSNGLNDLYDKLNNQYAGTRDINQVTSVLGPLSNQYGFVVGQDYEKIENARKLEQNEYDYNPNLGYISLRSALNSDEILAVAYEYNIGGEVYRVGEFSNDVTLVDEIKNPTLFLKLLKGTNLSPSLPTWELMMKNIYSLNAYQINPQDFYLDIIYQDDKTGTAINYIPAGAIDGDILLKVLNLDNLNFQLDPQPDGVFDFIDGITIDARNGKLIFPVVQPFGSYLRKKIENNNPANSKIADEYVFEELYTMTQSRAQQIAQKNKFYISGRYKGSSSSDIQIGSMGGNIPQGSVVVTANGRNLVENQDYTVDYAMGRVKIINESLLSSGTPIKISLESQSTFGVMNKSLIGTHLDYSISNEFTLGGTILHLKERPLTKKVNIGEEPISNTILGLNMDYRNGDLPFLTRLVDKLPFIETKERSTFSFNGEFAQLIPGHSRAIEKNGVSYIDDFEGSQTSIDIKQRFTWLIASVPQFQDDLFPEAKLTNDYAYGHNRAKLAWYNIDPLFLRNNSSTPNHIANNKDEQMSHFTREIQEKEIFPFKESPNNIPQNLSILNLAFYPEEKGPYNFDVEGTQNISAGIDNEGKLRNPETRWGGIMREIRQNDFEAANFEYIEFWMMDPFVEDEENGIVRNDRDPGLYFNLGNISEDILKDSRKSFENGLPSTDVVSLVDTTVWGRVPLSQSYVNAFDNDDNSRQYQDIGLDGLNDDDEKSFFKSYLDSIDKVLTPNSEPWNAIYRDPSGDNYHYFRGRDYDTEKIGILDRYKMFNGLEGNSPTSQQSNESYPTSASTIPDGEDINQDNTLSETEAYFQYKINLSPEELVVGRNFITDKVNGKNKEGDPVTWYQFKIPIYEPEKVVGSIQDFKSIRFMRMFLRGFEENILLRFATLELVRGEWRKYNYSLREGSEYTSIPEVSNGSFEVSAVNIEENGSKTPVNYVLPPGITRVTDPANAHIRMLNEQSMVLKVTDLDDGDAKAAYKNVSLDVRQYKTLQMDIHAEAFDENTLNDNELVAFIRIGSDYTQNYYEYEVPLALTPHLIGSSRYDNYNLNDRFAVWPEQNHMEIPFLRFQQVKQERNDMMRQAGSTVTINTNYSIMDGNNRVIVKGNPNLSNIRTIMLGVRNPGKTAGFYSGDDGLPKSGEIWMNELRLTDFDESGGWAGVGRISATLADFGRVTISGNTKKPGFGSIEKKVNNRLKEEINQYDISSTFELGKFFPKKAGVKIPVFFGLSEGIRNPKFNPLDPDIPLTAALDNAKTKAERDTIIHNAQDYTRRKSFNLSNIKIEKEGPSRQQAKFYSISNFSLSYAYNEIFARNVNTEFRINRNYTGN